jgi:tetratricopeptide (TPR) repeat protein
MLASPAAAQEDTELAMPIFEAGLAYYNQGNYEKALEQFEEAYRLNPLPELLYNIGQCHERLGDYETAIESYAKYLKEHPDAEDRQAVEQKIKNIESKLAKTGILLTVSEDGADIFVDDLLVATSPAGAAINTKPGTHELRVEKQGFQTVKMKVTVPAGHTQETQVTLVPVPPEPPPEPGKKPTWFYWTFGVAGAAGLAAVVTGSLALKNAGDARDAPTQDLWQSEKLLARKLAISTDVLIGAAGALALVSTIGIIVAARSTETKANAMRKDWLVSPVAGQGHGGLVLQMTF